MWMRRGARANSSAPARTETLERQQGPPTTTLQLLQDSFVPHSAPGKLTGEQCKILTPKRHPSRFPSASQQRTYLIPGSTPQFSQLCYKGRLRHHLRSSQMDPLLAKSLLNRNRRSKEQSSSAQGNSSDQCPKLESIRPLPRHAKCAGRPCTAGIYTPGGGERAKTTPML